MKVLVDEERAGGRCDGDAGARERAGKIEGRLEKKRGGRRRR